MGRNGGIVREAEDDPGIGPRAKQEVNTWLPIKGRVGHRDVIPSLSNPQRPSGLVSVARISFLYLFFFVRIYFLVPFISLTLD